MQIAADVEMVEGLSFRNDGALPFRAAISGADLGDLTRLESGGPGRRLVLPGLPVRLLPLTLIARRLIGEAAHPVRAILFDKTADRNWALGWHQDRTIAVRSRIETPGFGPWTVKDGLPHVAPPIGLLERMATLRLHLDPCDLDNAPLKVALGSHKRGSIPAAGAALAAVSLPMLTCLAATGDVWAYATPILHASDRAAAPSRRRVLQVDYSIDHLPGGLEWLGVEP